MIRPLATANAAETDHTVCFTPPPGGDPALVVVGWRDTDVDLFAIGWQDAEGIRLLTESTYDGVSLLRLIGPPAGTA